MPQRAHPICGFHTGAELPGSRSRSIARCRQRARAAATSRRCRTCQAAPAAPLQTGFAAEPDSEVIFGRQATGAPVAANGAAAMPRRRSRRIGTAHVETGLHSTVDFADSTGISGWVWNPEDPQQRFALELFDGDALLTTVLANQYRADLVEAGFGDGCYGFSIAFSETLLPYARHVLHSGRWVGGDLPSFPLVLIRGPGRARSDGAIRPRAI